MYNGSPYNDIYTQQNSRNSQLEVRTGVHHDLRQSRVSPVRNHPSVVINPNAISSPAATIRSEDPPSYYEAVVSPSLNEPPPSYDSIHGRVIEAQRQSTDVLDFTKKLFIIFCGTISCTFVLGFTIIIPACMIIFGLIYLKDCPQGHFIPIYLLIGGIMGILKQLLSVSVYVRNNEEDQQLERSRQSGTHRMIHLFMLCWFLVGSYWVYRIYEPNYDPSKGEYCNQTLYLFSFWLISFVYIGVGLITTVLLIISILSCVLRSRRVTNNSNV